MSWHNLLISSKCFKWDTVYFEQYNKKFRIDLPWPLAPSSSWTLWLSSKVSCRTNNGLWGSSYVDVDGKYKLVISFQGSSSILEGWTTSFWSFRMHVIIELTPGKSYFTLIVWLVEIPSSEPVGRLIYTSAQFWHQQGHTYFSSLVSVFIIAWNRALIDSSLVLPTVSSCGEFPELFDLSLEFWRLGSVLLLPEDSFKWF